MIRIAFALFMCAYTLPAFASIFAADISTPQLETIHAKIVSDYPTISHISGTDVERIKAEHPTDLLILDTRAEKEFSVSHIEGAQQVNPKISTASFLARFAPLAKGKTLIVYCSVGRRSSHLGERLQSAVLAAGAARVLNMEGGLFGWHNDGRALINAQGPTPFIHPYNFVWKQRLKNKHLARYNP